MTSRLQVAVVTLAAAIGWSGAGGTAVAAPQQEDMKARHAEMKARHDDMTARQADLTVRMAALDARIQLLTQQMNAFVGDARINAMAALLAAVVEQSQMVRSAATETKSGMAAMMASCAMHEKPDPSAAPSHDHTESQE